MISQWQTITGGRWLTGEPEPTEEVDAFDPPVVPETLPPEIEPDTLTGWV